MWPSSASSLQVGILPRPHGGSTTARNEERDGNEESEESEESEEGGQIDLLYLVCRSVSGIEPTRIETKWRSSLATHFTPPYES